MKTDKPASEIAGLFTSRGIPVDEVVRVGTPFEKTVVAEVVSVQTESATLFDGKDVTEVGLGSAQLQADVRVAYDPDRKKVIAELDVGIEGSTRPVLLGAECETGTPVLNWVDDEVLVTESLPNRGDLTGVLGIARELACYLGQELVVSPTALIETGEPISSDFVLEVRDQADTPDYIARLVRDVRAGPSPFWLKWRLIACGVRPISNVVDITNYILFKYGQPLHGFDFRKLQGGRLVTRRAAPGETLVTIDRVERKLTPDVLVIADAKGPVAIAGIMGGLASEISDSTRDVLIECARFTPVVIRHGTRAIGLTTEASQRFEVGIDAGTMEMASQEAARLMDELCSGKVAPGRVEVRSESPRREIDFSWQHASRVLGMELDSGKMAAILERLGFHPVGTGDRVRITVPSYRADIEGDADVVEELGRIAGYDGIPAETSFTAREPGQHSAHSQDMARVREILVGAGFDEIQSLSFVPTETARMWGGDRTILVPKPLNDRYSALRTSLLPGLLEAASLNLRRGNRDLRLFEMGAAYTWAGDPGREPREAVRLAGLIAGASEPLFWERKQNPVGFYDIAGVLESTLHELHVAGFEIVPGRAAGFAAEETAEFRFDGQTLGWTGRVAGDLAKRYDIADVVYAFDLDFGVLRTRMTAERTCRPLPRFPSVVRDYAFLVNADIPAARLIAAIRDAVGASSAQVEIFDRFRGKALPTGKQSVAVRVTFRAEDHTLTSAEVDDLGARLVARLGQELGAQLRK